MPESKQDRELIELLNELRVVLPGIQVLFAFLLVVPFNQRFPQVTEVQRNVYFAAFILVTIATALLIAPTGYHRLRWREHDKEQMLETSNRLAITGLVFLAGAMTCVAYLITSVLYDSGLAALVAAGAAGVFSWFWFGMPLIRQYRDNKGKKS